jgi:uncharacterized integral membrane protein (TIGR00697 family)
VSAQQDIPFGTTVLAALFVTALVTAQLTAAKVLAFPSPVGLPFTGSTLVLPGAALAYAVTFFASDCYTELYGRWAATRLVNTAFLMNFVVLALVFTTIAAPAADSSIDPNSFAEVLGASGNIVAGSLVAYLVSQNWDVFIFHTIRDWTNGNYLWLRNIGSTATSQLLDTVIFVGIAFYLLPTAGIGPQLPTTVVLGLMIGQYILKLGIAVLDTPLVYLVVQAVRGKEQGHESPILS